MTALAKTEPAKVLAAVERVARPDSSIVLTSSPAEAAARYRELQAFVQEAMNSGTDYAVIPGAGDTPALLQPGAQKLCELYGFAWRFEDDHSIQDWDKGLFVFRKRCVLMLRRSNVYVGEGVGSCNSKEDRYAWRWVSEKQLAPGLDKTKLKTRSGKYGTSFRVPNEDVFRS